MDKLLLHEFAGSLLINTAPFAFVDVFERGKL